MAIQGSGQLSTADYCYKYHPTHSPLRLYSQWSTVSRCGTRLPLLSGIGNTSLNCDGNFHLVCMIIMLQYRTVLRFSADTMDISLKKPESWHRAWDRWSAFKTLCFWRKTVNKKAAFTVKLREKNPGTSGKYRQEDIIITTQFLQHCKHKGLWPEREMQKYRATKFCSDICGSPVRNLLLATFYRLYRIELWRDSSSFGKFFHLWPDNKPEKRKAALCFSPLIYPRLYIKPTTVQIQERIASTRVSLATKSADCICVLLLEKCLRFSSVLNTL
jgi:hypothetical protein